MTDQARMMPVPAGVSVWKKCGHLRTPENTRRDGARTPGGRCRTCKDAKQAHYRRSEKGRDAQARSRAKRGSSGAHAAEVRAAYTRKKEYLARVFENTPSKRVQATAATVVVLSDVQLPFEDPEAVQRALDVLYKVEPDLVVLNGDIVDCYAESSFPKDPRKRDTATLAGHQRARELMACLVDVPQKVWLGGNHEDRWRRVIWDELNAKGTVGPVATNLLAVQGMVPADLTNDTVVSFARLYGMSDYGFTYYPYGHRLYLAEGNLVVTHGKYVSRHSGYSAKRTFEWLGRSCIVGHTHRQGTYRVTLDGVEHGAWENGCLCLLEPEYDDTPNWQQGFSIVKINGPEFHVVQIPIIRRSGKPVAVYHGLEAI